MLKIALYIILVAEAFFFTWMDKRAFGNYFSPLAVLAFPLIFIIGLALLTSTVLGFVPVSHELLYLSICGLLIFWSGSLFWSLLIPSSILSRVSRNFTMGEIPVSFNLRKIMLVVSWMVIALMAYSFVFAYSSTVSVSDVGTDEFTRAYGGSGWAGHVLGFTIPLIIFWIGIVSRKDYFVLLTVVCLVFLCLLYQVKTWLFIPLIGGVLVRMYYAGKLKIKILPALLAAVVVVLLFMLTYAYSIDAEEYTFWEKIEMLLKHFTGYVYAGVLGFSEHTRQGLPLGVDPEGLFANLRNLFNVIAGREVSGVVSPYHVLIDEKGLVDVNVKTFFGTILVNGGIVIAIIYTFFLSIIFYFLWILSSLTRNYWLVIMYTFFASALVVGWFDFYYNQLPFLELPFYIGIFALLTYKKNRKLT